jgi:hypothetical protein
MCSRCRFSKKEICSIRCISKANYAAFAPYKKKIEHLPLFKTKSAAFIAFQTKEMQHLPHKKN